MINRLPAGPMDRDLQFDRWQFDDAGSSSSTVRSMAYSWKDRWASGGDINDMGKNGRVKRKKQAL